MKRFKYDYIIEKEIAAGTIEINEDYIGNDPIVLPENYKSKKVAEEKVSW